MKRIFEFLDQRSAFQRIVLIWLCWLTTWVTLWSADFAYAKLYDPLGVAAVIAAVMAPIATLQGLIFKWYCSDSTEVNKP